MTSRSKAWAETQPLVGRKKQLLLTIASAVDETGACRSMTQDELAASCGCTVRQVRRLVGELAAARYLAHIRRGRRGGGGAGCVCAAARGKGSSSRLTNVRFASVFDQTGHLMEGPAMKHYVRVCRPRFEVALIEVEASDSESAERLALAHADGTDAGGWWLLPFDKSAYRAHVERCIPAAHVADAIGANSPDYALLHADVNSGEGEVVLQPWFTDHAPDLMEHDLCRDWIEALQQHADDGLVGFERACASDGDPD